MTVTGERLGGGPVEVGVARYVSELTQYSITSCTDKHLLLLTDALTSLIAALKHCSAFLVPHQSREM